MTGPAVAGVRLVTADDLCRAVEAVLAADLPGWAAAAGLVEPGEPGVRTWQQLPTPEALSSATFPAGAITSPGLTGPPAKSRNGYDATWRLAVAVYDRGTDHADTAGRVRRWAALVRTVLVSSSRLGGLAYSVTWVGEDYAARAEPGSARTLGGCSVAFDVLVRDVVPSAVPPELGGAPAGPVVTSTATAVTVHTPTVGTSSSATVRRPAQPQE